MGQKPFDKEKIEGHIDEIIERMRIDPGFLEAVQSRAQDLEYPFWLRGSGFNEGGEMVSRSGKSLSVKILDKSKTPFDYELKKYEFFDSLEGLLAVYRHELEQIWLKEKESLWVNLIAVGGVAHKDFTVGVVGGYDAQSKMTQIDVVAGDIFTAVAPTNVEEGRPRPTVMTMRIDNEKGHIFLKKPFLHRSHEISYLGEHYQREEDTEDVWEQLTEDTVFNDRKDPSKKFTARSPLTRKEILHIADMMKRGAEKRGYNTVWEMGVIKDKKNQENPEYFLVQADPLISLGQYQPIPKDLNPDDILAESVLTHGNIDMTGKVMVVKVDAKKEDILAAAQELHRQGIPIIKVQINPVRSGAPHEVEGFDVIVDPLAVSKWPHTSLNIRDILKAQNRPMAYVGGEEVQEPLRQLHYHKIKDGIFISKSSVRAVVNDFEAVFVKSDQKFAMDKEIEDRGEDFLDTMSEVEGVTDEFKNNYDRFTTLEKLFNQEKEKNLFKKDITHGPEKAEVFQFLMEYLYELSGIQQPHEAIEKLFWELQMEIKWRPQPTGTKNYVTWNEERIGEILEDEESKMQLKQIKNFVKYVEANLNDPLYPSGWQSNVVAVLDEFMKYTKNMDLKLRKEPPPNRPKDKSFTVMIVDDDVLFAEDYEDLIKDTFSNSVVYRAKEEGDAKKLFEEGVVPDVMVMDDQMPRTNSEGLAKAFVEISDNPVLLGSSSCVTKSFRDKLSKVEGVKFKGVIDKTGGIRETRPPLEDIYDEIMQGEGRIKQSFEGNEIFEIVTDELIILWLNTEEDFFREMDIVETDKLKQFLQMIHQSLKKAKGHDEMMHQIFEYVPGDDLLKDQTLWKTILEIEENLKSNSESFDFAMMINSKKSFVVDYEESGWISIINKDDGRAMFDFSVEDMLRNVSLNSKDINKVAFWGAPLKDRGAILIVKNVDNTFKIIEVGKYKKEVDVQEYGADFKRRYLKYDSVSRGQDLTNVPLLKIFYNIIQDDGSKGEVNYKIG